jgi:ketosteroid isomerase-like protein
MWSDVALVLALTGILAQNRPADDVPPALIAMADAERAFAASARELGVRDAFLKFLTADAVMFLPDPVAAHEGLVNSPSVPFADEPLTWEPRLGDIAASGELGWLTGPSAMAVARGSDRDPRHTNYLSVWKRQPDGAWRVIIDVGTRTPEEPPFAPGFNRFRMSERWASTAGSPGSAVPLGDADRALNDGLAQRGLRDGYAHVLMDATRFHRGGAMPVVGREAILERVASKEERYAGSLTRVETAASGDLGFSYGSYVLSGPAPESGSYLRIWHRGANGDWYLVVDLAQRRPAK